MYPESAFSHNWLIKRAVNDKVRQVLPELTGRVLDLGCGVRPFEQDILCHASEYIGVDWSNCLHGRRADIEADLNQPLPIEDNFADHIVCFEVLEHLREPKLMLTEAYRILKPQGSMVLSVPFQWWVHEAPWDFYRYTRFGLIYLFESAGFTNVSVAPTTGFWSMWLLKLNYQLCRLVRGPRIVQILTRSLLVPVWWVNQQIACVLDRFWPEENETAGYFVTAVKP